MVFWQTVIPHVHKLKDASLINAADDHATVIANEYKWINELVHNVFSKLYFLIEMQKNTESMISDTQLCDE